MKKETFVKCLVCGTVINVDTGYHYIECKCGAVAVDSGKDYCRVIGEQENWKFVEI